MSRYKLKIWNNNQEITPVLSRENIPADVFIYEVDALPTPSADISFKICRYQNKLYQCIDKGEGYVWDEIGAGGGTEYTAGSGILINNHVISLDNSFTISTVKASLETTGLSFGPSSHVTRQSYTPSTTHPTTLVPGKVYYFKADSVPGTIPSTEPLSYIYLDPTFNITGAGPYDEGFNFIDTEKLSRASSITNLPHTFGYAKQRSQFRITMQEGGYGQLIENTPLTFIFKYVRTVGNESNILPYIYELAEAEINAIDITIDGNNKVSAISKDGITYETYKGTTVYANPLGATSPLTSISINGSTYYISVDTSQLSGEAPNLIAGNLLNTEFDENTSLYSTGPTGGYINITKDTQETLEEIRGYSIVWNVRNQADGIPLNSAVVMWKNNATRFSADSDISFASSASSVASYCNYVDLNTLFGGPNNIPFSLSNVTEYPKNGDLPAQTVTPLQQFLRLFGTIEITPTFARDIGTLKHVNASAIVEEGRNLYDSTTMGTNGVRLLAGYAYEVYLASGKSINVRRDGDNWGYQTANLTRVKLANGQYIWYYKPAVNCHINASNLRYVGFVHSGNDVITTGGISSDSAATTDRPIPEYWKETYQISASNLKGIPCPTTKCDVYDTIDTTRTREIDLSTLNWTPSNDGTYYTDDLVNTDSIKPDSTVLAEKYLMSDIVVDSNGRIIITSSSAISGKMVYELTVPSQTGRTFTPIKMKVEDMGCETVQGLTFAPLYQKSYYSVNLRDKIQNLDLPKDNGYLYSNPGLNGLYLNGVNYRLLPLGKISHNRSIAIGENVTAGAADSIVIGVSTSATATANQTRTTGASATAIGYVCTAAKEAVALGYRAQANGSDSVAINGTAQKEYTTAINATCYGTNSTAILCGSSNKINNINNSAMITKDDQIIHFKDLSQIYFRNASMTTSGTTAVTLPYPAWYPNAKTLQQYFDEKCDNSLASKTEATTLVTDSLYFITITHGGISSGAIARAVSTTTLATTITHASGVIASLTTNGSAWSATDASGTAITISGDTVSVVKM